MSLGAWEIGPDDVPRRLDADRDFLEKHLEDWVERDPSLISSDIRWVSRQLVFADQSRLDLLGLTRDGTWVVVELKRGLVSTSTVLQAMHYFLNLEAMSNAELVDRIFNSSSRLFGVGGLEEELDDLRGTPEDSTRDHRLVVAGVGTDGSAERAAELLSRHGFDVPVQIVSFDLLRDAAGKRVLVREVDDDNRRPSERPAVSWSYDGVLDLADQLDVRDGFEAVCGVLRDRGYRQYLKKRGLNFNLGGRLQVFWITPAAEGKVHVGYLGSNFPALFGVEEAEAAAVMGPNWLDLEPLVAVARVREWCDAIDNFRRRTSTSDS